MASDQVHHRTRPSAGHRDADIPVREPFDGQYARECSHYTAAAAFRGDRMQQAGVQSRRPGTRGEVTGRLCVERQ